MNQLSFQPAFDVYHSSFRFLRIFGYIGSDKPLSLDLARIIDYYLLFFHRMESVRLRRTDSAIKKLAKQKAGDVRYELQPDDKLLFARMEPFQLSALRTLALSGYLDLDELNNRRVSFLGREIPLPLRERVLEANQKDQDVMDALFAVAREYPVMGRDGLKDRTGLLEYRYDPV